MQVRRVVLLFAIVVAVSAIAASIAPRRDEPARRDAPSPGRQGRERTVARPREVARRPASIALEVGARPPRTRALKVGDHVIVRVTVPEAGQVSLAGLGEVQPAGPGTPAVFDLLPADPGRFEVAFAPADGGRVRPAGTLVVSR